MGSSARAALMFDAMGVFEDFGYLTPPVRPTEDDKIKALGHLIVDQ